ncbi:MAG: matrixin family metalloprotease [Acidobacteriota bacterium]
MTRSRLIVAAPVAAALLVASPSVMGFDVEPFVKFFIDQRPVTTMLNLGTLPSCCLGDAAAWEAELQATLALIPDTACSADDGLRGSTGDLLFTPFEIRDDGSRPRNDGRTLVRFKNQGQFTLGETAFWIFGETQNCAGSTFYKTADADVTLNKQVQWVSDPGSPFCPGSSNHFSLRSTALHELGHVVGLEHTNVQDALMFAFGDPCDFSKETFQADDQAQFDFIYACEDVNCLPEPPAPTENKCRDGIDNDGDGLADCADPDCASKGFCR